MTNLPRRRGRKPQYAQGATHPARILHRDSHGNPVFDRPPVPLLPKDDHPRAFFDSIVHLAQLIREKPQRSARQLYQIMCDWADTTALEGEQAVFDAFYMVGAVDQVNYLRRAAYPVGLILPPDLSLRELRNYCLEKFCHRVRLNPELLLAVSQQPYASVNDLAKMLKEPEFSIALRLKLLASFEAVQENAHRGWQLTPVGWTMLESLAPERIQHPVTNTREPEDTDNSDDLLDDFELVPPPKPTETEPSPGKTTVFTFQNTQPLMRAALIEGLKIVFPLHKNLEILVKPHCWRETQCVGTTPEAYWQGWSANLSGLDPAYKTIYVDYVRNILPPTERFQLFGRHFAERIEKQVAVVVIFVTGFGRQAETGLLARGIIPRHAGNTAIHATYVADTAEFHHHAPPYWAAKIVHLLNLQRAAFLSQSSQRPPT